MSVSNRAEAIAALERSAESVLAAVEDLTNAGAAGEVSEETAQRLMLAAVRLFAHKVDQGQRDFAPVPAAANISATEAAVTVTGLMRAADLNTFDLAMWYGRTQPNDQT